MIMTPANKRVLANALVDYIEKCKGITEELNNGDNTGLRQRWQINQFRAQELLKHFAAD